MIGDLVVGIAAGFGTAPAAPAPAPPPAVVAPASKPKPAPPKPITATPPRPIPRVVAPAATVAYWVEADLPGFGRNEVAKVTAEAAALWMNAANVRIVPAASRAQANLVIVADDGWYLGLTTVGGPNLFRRGGGALMRLSRAHRRTRSYLLSNVAHEMGHALGLDHAAPGNVMEPICTGVTRLTPTDVAGVAALYGSRPR